QQFQAVNDFALQIANSEEIADNITREVFFRSSPSRHGERPSDNLSQVLVNTYHVSNEVMGEETPGAVTHRLSAQQVGAVNEHVARCPLCERRGSLMPAGDAGTSAATLMPHALKASIWRDLSARVRTQGTQPGVPAGFAA